MIVTKMMRISTQKLIHSLAKMVVIQVLMTMMTLIVATPVMTMMMKKTMKTMLTQMSALVYVPVIWKQLIYRVKPIKIISKGKRGILMETILHPKMTVVLKMLNSKKILFSFPPKTPKDLK